MTKKHWITVSLVGLLVAGCASIVKSRSATPEPKPAPKLSCEGPSCPKPEVAPEKDPLDEFVTRREMLSVLNQFAGWLQENGMLCPCDEGDGEK